MLTIFMLLYNAVSSNHVFFPPRKVRLAVVFYSLANSHQLWEFTCRYDYHTLSSLLDKPQEPQFSWPFWHCAFQLRSHSPPVLAAQDFTMWKAGTPFLLSLALVFTKFPVNVVLIVQLSKRHSFITLWKISFCQSIGCFRDILKTAR